MIKMALDEYDTLEITIGARLPVGLIEVSHREAAGFRAPKTFVSFRDHFGCPTITQVQLSGDRNRLRLYGLERRTGS
jgi:hypothetical protein